MAILSWQHATGIPSRSFVCGHCGNPLASNIGYWRTKFEDGSGEATEYIHICHHCRRPTYFDRDRHQTPGVRFGADVKGIDEATVEALYNEARDCFSKTAFTATVLSCRKLLMHVAVAKGADPGKSFIQYVEYLSGKGYVPPDAKGWVDHIPAVSRKYSPKAP
jgi:hypothetical protein